MVSAYWQNIFGNKWFDTFPSTLFRSAECHEDKLNDNRERQGLQTIIQNFDFTAEIPQQLNERIIDKSEIKSFVFVVVILKSVLVF